LNRDDEASLGMSWKPLIQSMKKKEKKIISKERAGI
jgi:hypothetical protein